MLDALKSDPLHLEPPHFLRSEKLIKDNIKYFHPSDLVPVKIGSPQTITEDIVPVQQKAYWVSSPQKIREPPALLGNIRPADQQLVVPCAIYREVLPWSHDSLMGGNFGNKTCLKFSDLCTQ